MTPSDEAALRCLFHLHALAKITASHKSRDVTKKVKPIISLGDSMISLLNTKVASLWKVMAFHEDTISPLLWYHQFPGVQSQAVDRLTGDSVYENRVFGYSPSSQGCDQGKLSLA